MLTNFVAAIEKHLASLAWFALLSQVALQPFSSFIINWAKPPIKKETDKEEAHCCVSPNFASPFNKECRELLGRGLKVYYGKLVL